MSDRARTIKDGPWCWQSKPARDAIRDAFDATNNVASALGVYDALTEEASDKQAETFTTTHAHLQELSGVSIATIKKVLRVLEEIELLRVSVPKFRAPSTYTLLSLANGWLAPLANGTQSGSLAASEEGQKGKKTNNKTVSPLAGTASAQPIPPWSLLAELKAEAEANHHEVEFGKWYDMNERKGWLHTNKTTGKPEPIKNHRASLAAFIKHISAENQCRREKSDRNRTGMISPTEYANGF